MLTGDMCAICPETKIVVFKMYQGKEVDLPSISLTQHTDRALTMLKEMK